MIDKFEDLAIEKKTYGKKVQKRADNLLNKLSVIKSDDEDEEEKEDQQFEISDHQLLKESQRPIAVLEYDDEESDSEPEYDSETGEKIEHDVFVPRRKLAIHKQIYGKEMKEQKGKPFKFTAGTDPLVKDKITFLVEEAISCPQFLPMKEFDCIVSAHAFQASIINSEIPIQEYVRKEHYFNCFKAFTKAVSADPALIKVEIQKKLKYFDYQYGIIKTP